MKIDSHLSPAQRRILDEVCRIAIDLGLRPFLVGGSVRDLLLARQPLDLDLTLEQGSARLAGELARRLGGRLQVHDRFLTTKVIPPTGREIDVATTRREIYERAGALPSVSPGVLTDDLLRRDFSVNAIAFDLLDEGLVDPAGGESDLRNRTIRVLHARSFLDDPTRILRALRLAVRLEFHLDPGTDALLDEAIRANAAESVSRDRLWRELLLAISEEKAGEVLARYTRRGVVQEIFGPMGDPGVVAAGLERVDSLSSISVSADRDVIFLTALLRDHSAPQRALEHSPLTRRRMDRVLYLIEHLDDWSATIRAEEEPRGRLRLCREAPVELRLLAAGSGDDLRAIFDWFLPYESIELPSGDELEIEPGPHVGRALERTRDAVFLGEISETEATSFARRKALQYLKESE